MMIFRKALFALIGLLSLSTLGLAQDDAKAQALRDVQIGMQGLMQATEDPALLAQLMRDMQVRRREEEENFLLHFHAFFIVENRSLTMRQFIHSIGP